MALKDKIKFYRERAKMSQQDLADAVGVRQNTVAAIETGKTKRTKYLQDIARALRVPVEELDSSQPSVVNAALTPNTNIQEGERNLPVYGAAEGGRGVLIMSSEPVEYTSRPAPLQGVRDGYGIIVVGESMVPVYEPGDTVLVHPHLPPSPDCDVVLYAESSDGEHRVTVKRLVRVTAKEWHLRQHNPKKDFTLPRSEWQRCHRVVGKYNKR